ncbi:MAG: hypothetical protein JWN67_2296 [Actinomycetia bacterium]|nr:hypothetical protein [Actinomycetes bacterium]
MPYPKSDMRAGAEQAVAGARAGLLAVLAIPTVAADGTDSLLEAIRTSDHATAVAEASRLAQDHPEVGEAWRGLDEAIKFLAFSLLTDMADGTE